MKKTAAFVLTLPFVFAGCQLLDRVPISIFNGNNTPPAITAIQNSVTLQGVEGSYCYKTVCVDKISVLDLIAEAGLAFQQIQPETVTLKTKEVVTGWEVGLKDENGTTLKCALKLNPGEDSKSVDVDLCSMSEGSFILSVSAEFENGGDTSWFFPLEIKK